MRYSIKKIIKISQKLKSLINKLFYTEFQIKLIFEFASQNDYNFNFYNISVLYARKQTESENIIEGKI